MPSISKSRNFVSILLWSLFVILRPAESFVTPSPTESKSGTKRTRSSNIIEPSSCRHASSSDDSISYDGSAEESMNSWDHEETLLAMNLCPVPDKTLGESLKRVSQYTQSFPFAAVLPVQPLQYLPTEDGGVDLKFLRKKTDIKSGIDGGIRFFVRRKNHDDEVEEDTVITSQDGIEVIAKRNSKGQTISKIFAEKLVIQAFVKGMTMGAEEKSTGIGPSTTTASTSSSFVAPKTRFDSPTTDMVTLESVFHKWM